MLCYLIASAIDLEIGRTTPFLSLFVSELFVLTVCSVFLLSQAKAVANRVLPFASTVGGQSDHWCYYKLLREVLPHDSKGWRPRQRTQADQGPTARAGYAFRAVHITACEST
jgi:hypothetical protein